MAEGSTAPETQNPTLSPAAAGSPDNPAGSRTPPSAEQLQTGQVEAKDFLADLVAGVAAKHAPELNVDPQQIAENMYTPFGIEPGALPQTGTQTEPSGGVAQEVNLEHPFGAGAAEGTLPTIAIGAEKITNVMPPPHESPREIISRIARDKNIQTESQMLRALLEINPYLVWERVEELISGIERQGREFPDPSAEGILGAINEGLSTNPELQSKLSTLVFARHRYQNVDFGAKVRGLEMVAQQLGALSDAQNRAILELGGVELALEILNNKEVFREKDALNKKLLNDSEQQALVALDILGGKDILGMPGKTKYAEYQDLYRTDLTGVSKENLMALFKTREPLSKLGVDISTIHPDQLAIVLETIEGLSVEEKTWLLGLDRQHKMAFVRVEAETTRAFDLARKALNVVGISGRYDAPMMETEPGVFRALELTDLDPVVRYQDPKGNNITVHLNSIPELAVVGEEVLRRFEGDEEQFKVLAGKTVEELVVETQRSFGKNRADWTDREKARFHEIVGREVRGTVAKEEVRQGVEGLAAGAGELCTRLVSLWAIEKLKKGNEVVARKVEEKLAAGEGVTDLSKLDEGFSYKIAMAWDEALRKFFVENFDKINVHFSSQGDAPTALKRAYFFPVFINRTSNEDRGKAEFLRRYAHLNALDLLSYTGRTSVKDQLLNWGSDIGIILSWAGRLKGADDLKKVITAKGEIPILEEPGVINNTVDTVGKLKGKILYLPTDEIKDVNAHILQGLLEFRTHWNRRVFGTPNADILDVNKALIEDLTQNLIDEDDKRAEERHFFRNRLHLPVFIHKFIEVHIRRMMNWGGFLWTLLVGFLTGQPPKR